MRMNVLVQWVCWSSC